LLDEVGLADRAHTAPDRLSGGEQQRVAVARALVHDPLLVLADEPTGNLDVETGNHVLELLTRLTGARGRALLMVTHSREVAQSADRIVRIQAGNLLDEPGQGEVGP
jgi:putative ABC transport system ATP-binding protein